MPYKKVIFVTAGVAGRASEELWWRTAVNLAKQHFAISASVSAWPPSHPCIASLEAAGVRVWSRPKRYSLWNRGWHYIFHKGKRRTVCEVEKLLRAGHPNLVVFSAVLALPPLELLELCIDRRLPFVTIANGCSERDWPDDPYAERYRTAFTAARRCYFVSRANLKLTEKQIGSELPNAEVIWSQYNVGFNSSPPWPTHGPASEMRLACVGRLDPPSKGQDILLEALASSAWENRPWHLTLYGEGSKGESLERLTARLGLSDRVTFAGYAAVEKIWSSNEVLVMPSRHEGLPLAMIEAMLCGRPVVATDVGGNSEILVDGVTGILVDVPTVASVRQGLERLWENRRNLQNMGRAGAERIRSLAPEDPIRVFSEKIRNLI